jgi:hypothetical protein
VAFPEPDHCTLANPGCSRSSAICGANRAFRSSAGVFGIASCASLAAPMATPLQPICCVRSAPLIRPASPFGGLLVRQIPGHAYTPQLSAGARRRRLDGRWRHRPRFSVAALTASAALLAAAGIQRTIPPFLRASKSSRNSVVGRFMENPEAPAGGVASRGGLSFEMRGRPHRLLRFGRL